MHVCVVVYQWNNLKVNAKNSWMCVDAHEHVPQHPQHPHPQLERRRQMQRRLRLRLRLRRLPSYSFCLFISLLSIYSYFLSPKATCIKIDSVRRGGGIGRADEEGNADSGRRRNETDSISGRRRERDIFRSFHLFCMHTHVYPHRQTHTPTHACIHLWTHNVHLFVCFAVCFLPPALALVVLFLVRIWVPKCLAQHNPTVCHMCVCVWVCVCELLSECRSVSLLSLFL